MLILISRLFMLDRLLRRHRRTRGRAGFFGPMPYYSGRTRRGSRVTVTGCCLPLPLGMLGALALGLRLLAGR